MSLGFHNERRHVGATGAAAGGANTLNINSSVSGNNVVLSAAASAEASASINPSLRQQQLIAKKKAAAIAAAVSAMPPSSPILTQQQQQYFNNNNAIAGVGMLQQQQKKEKFVTFRNATASAATSFSDDPDELNSFPPIKSNNTSFASNVMYKNKSVATVSDQPTQFQQTTSILATPYNMKHQNGSYAATAASASERTNTLHHPGFRNKKQQQPQLFISSNENNKTISKMPNKKVVLFSADEENAMSYDDDNVDDNTDADSVIKVSDQEEGVVVVGGVDNGEISIDNQNDTKLQEEIKDEITKNMIHHHFSNNSSNGNLDIYPAAAAAMLTKNKTTKKQAALAIDSKLKEEKMRNSILKEVKKEIQQQLNKQMEQNSISNKNDYNKSFIDDELNQIKLDISRIQQSKQEMKIQLNSLVTDIMQIKKDMSSLLQQQQQQQDHSTIISSSNNNKCLAEEIERINHDIRSCNSNLESMKNNIEDQLKQDFTHLYTLKSDFNITVDDIRKDLSLLSAASVESRCGDNPTTTTSSSSSPTV